MPVVRVSTLSGGKEYTYVERGDRACLLLDGDTVWWGMSEQAIPCGLVPLDVLLTLSLLRIFAWK